MLGKGWEDIYDTMGRYDNKMGGFRDGRKYTPDPVAWQASLSHPTYIPVSRRDIMWGRRVCEGEGR